MSKVRVRFSFLVFLALVFLLRDTSAIAAFSTVCIMHELGHFAAIYALGGDVRSLELTGTGIRITAGTPTSNRDGSIILLSGPAVNIAAFLVCTAAGSTGSFAQFSLAEGLFNLLPFSFLDGGALIEQYITGTVHERELRTVMRILQAVTVAAAVYMCIGA